MIKNSSTYQNTKSLTIKKQAFYQKPRHTRPERLRKCLSENKKPETHASHGLRTMRTLSVFFYVRARARVYVRNTHNYFFKSFSLYIRSRSGFSFAQAAYYLRFTLFTFAQAPSHSLRPRITYASRSYTGYLLINYLVFLKKIILIEVKNRKQGGGVSEL